MRPRLLDLFAGPGGWDEGVRPLGLAPLGIEWDTAAVETGQAAGHLRYQADIAALDPLDFRGIDGLIASPPCQGFSVAGKGRGRSDAELLLSAIPRMAHHDVRPELHDSMADDRSVLVLEPLRWALALAPRWLAWEQVPAVLPLWGSCAEVLRRIGYTVATGILSAEQYGVPQTRRRAILVARSAVFSRTHGPARLPEPTHSAYYPRDPMRLDMGVQPWVSMAEALGWGMTHRPGMTVTGGGTGKGGAEPFGNASRRGIARERDAGRWAYNRPATTIVGAFRPDIVAAPGHRTTVSRQDAPGSIRVSVTEAALLQTFPAAYPWQGTKTARYRQVGDAVPPLLARAVVAEVAALCLENEGEVAA